MKSKTHQVLVTVRFNKPVTAPAARRAFRNHVYGDFYAGDLSEMVGDGWERFKIGRVQRAPKAEG